MERIPEFNFPQFKPEIHNDKAGDQRGERDNPPTNKAHCRILKQNPVFSCFSYAARGFTHESESTRFTQGAAAADKVHNAFCFAVPPPIGHWH